MKKRIFISLDLLFVCTWPLTAWMFLNQVITGNLAYFLVSAHTGLACYVIVDFLIKVIKPQVFIFINVDNYHRMLKLYEAVVTGSMDELDRCVGYRKNRVRLNAVPETVMELGLHKAGEGDWEKVDARTEGYAMASFAAAYLIRGAMQRMEESDCRKVDLFADITKSLEKWDETIRPKVSEAYYKGRKTALSEVYRLLRTHRDMVVG